MRVHLGIATLCGSLLFGYLAPISAAADLELAAAARNAGAAVSARVFEETGPGSGESERESERPVVSGKMILLGATLISAAIVGAAFILRGDCEPATDGVFVRLPPVRLRLQEGVPPPPVPLPDVLLPDICVPR